MKWWCHNLVKSCSLYSSSQAWLNIWTTKLFWWNNCLAHLLQHSHHNLGSLFQPAGVINLEGGQVNVWLEPLSGTFQFQVLGKKYCEHLVNHQQMGVFAWILSSTCKNSVIDKIFPSNLAFLNPSLCNLKPIVHLHKARSSTTKWISTGTTNPHVGYSRARERMHDT